MDLLLRVYTYIEYPVWLLIMLFFMQSFYEGLHDLHSKTSKVLINQYSVLLPVMNLLRMLYAVAYRVVFYKVSQNSRKFH